MYKSYFLWIFEAFQFNEYALLWVTFLTTAWVLSKDNHVSVQVLVQYFDRKLKRVMNMIHAAVGAALCGIFCWYGIYTTRDHFVRGVIDVASVDVPKAYVLLVIPLGFGLLSLQFLRKLVLAWTEKERPTRGNHLDNAEQNLGHADGAGEAGMGGNL